MNTKKLIAAALTVTALLGSAAAHAGYYVPTCVPGYWTMGPFGPVWVPPFCF